MGLLETLGLRSLGAMPPPLALDREPELRRDADAPPAGSERETARAEADAVIAPLTALVEGGIRDPKLAAKIKAELAPIAAAFAKADQQKSDAAAIKAYKALLGPAGKLKTKAEQFQAAAELKLDQWDPAAARAKAAIAKVASAPAKAALQAELAKLEAAAKPKFAAGDQVGVEALLPGSSGSTRSPIASPTAARRSTPRSHASRESSPGWAPARRPAPASGSPRSRPRRSRPGRRARRSTPSIPLSTPSTPS